MLRVIATLLVVALAITAFTLLSFKAKVSDVAITIVGTFWGFFLTQAGLMLYENRKQKVELISMLVSAKNEVQMNKGTILWIKHLLDRDLAEKEIHGLGFSGLDEISAKAVENIVMSPLTYKFTSKEFSSQHLLSIYQTLLLFQREIPTDKVDGRDKSRYAGIKFGKVIGSFSTLNEWLDSEGEKLSGRNKWISLTAHISDPQQRLEKIQKAEMSDSN